MSSRRRSENGRPLPKRREYSLDGQSFVPATHRHAIRSILDVVEECESGALDDVVMYGTETETRLRFSDGMVSTWMIRTALQGTTIDWEMAARPTAVTVRLKR